MEAVERKLGFDRIREMISDKCATDYAVGRVREEQFSSDADIIRHRLALTDEMRLLLMFEDGFPTSGFIDCLPFLEALAGEGSVIDLHSLGKLRTLLDTLRRLTDFFDGSKSRVYPRLARLASPHQSFPEVRRRLEQILDKTGAVKDTASDALYSLRVQLHEKEGSISKRASALIRRAAQEGLVEADATPVIDSQRVTSVLLNASRNTVYLMQAISDFTLTLSKSGEAYDVPYSESFGSSTSMNDFTIIDGNGDGTTWAYNNMSGNVSYNWSTTNAADEWLITPAIRLEAGKSYKFTVKARSFTASMPERMEVMMGTDATAEAMTTTVIAATEVATGDLTPFQGTVRVTAEGNYRFGIHAISDADNMMLTIDDIAVEEDTTAPQLGDINGDGRVDVSDVNAAINKILKVTDTDLAARIERNVTNWLKDN